jgi:hypothetical protein
MSAEAKGLIEEIEKSYQFYVYLFTIFVVCMGVARWNGKQIWRKREESRRASSGLPVVALLSGSEQSFTYTSLFQGGLMGVYIAVTQLMYVVLMLTFNDGIGILTNSGAKPPTDIWGEVSILMWFPILMIPYFALMTIISFRRRISVSSCIIPVGAIVVCVAGAVAATWWVTDKSIVVAAEFLAVAILSLSASYFIGMADGIRSADPESNYPLVKIELHQGPDLDRVWLYKRTDSDYRLVTANGINHIIPTFNVKNIRKL